MGMNNSTEWTTNCEMAFLTDLPDQMDERLLEVRRDPASDEEVYAAYNKYLDAMNLRNWHPTPKPSLDTCGECGAQSGGKLIAGPFLDRAEIKKHIMKLRRKYAQRIWRTKKKQQTSSTVGGSDRIGKAEVLS
tara:strand:+ start:478 stop:876 length:399 start_codon:yes stop_codon:yes gene_type:complete